MAREPGGRVGFIGLGHMGARMVELLLDADQDVVVWARRAAAVEVFEGRVQVASTPAELARSCGIVGICVWDEAGVAEVLGGAEGVLAGLRPGAVVAVHSTVGPEASRRLAAMVEGAGGVFVDAPVSVRGPDRRLLVMVGGEASALDAHRGFFDAIGDPVVRLGPVGGGQLAKLMNNTMLAATVALGAEVVALGGELGLDVAGLLQVLTTGSAGGTWAALLAPSTSTGREALQGRTQEWATKDVGLALEALAAAAVATDGPAIQLARRTAGLG